MMAGKRIIIVGGVAGGASAAARARRMSEDAEIIMFERGDAISAATCGFPYYISGVIPEREHLFVQTPERMANRFKIDIRTGTEVIRINRERKEVVARDLSTGEEKVERYDVLILSPGAEPIRPDIPGINSSLVMSLRSVADTDRIRTFIDAKNPERAVILGGGYIGLEMAEALVERGVKVSLIELANQVMSPLDPEMAYYIHEHLRNKGVDLKLKNSVKKISETGDGLLLQLNTDETIACDLMLLGIGVKPEVKLAKEAGLKLGITGGILVDEFMRTSDPDIYAVGDAIEVTHLVGGFPALIPLAGPANRQARIAATNIFREQKLRYKNTQGTAICKVFELSSGVTGLNEKSLKRLGMAYEKIYLHPGSHASYYPGAIPLRVKLLFEPRSGKILGAQIVGTEGVDKRIDVLSVCIRAGMNVFELEDLELSYAPPYNSAKDPVNMAGFIASNILRGEVEVCHTEDVMNLRQEQFLLDVRTRSEFQMGAISGALNIPIDELRMRIQDVPKDKEILVYCATGLRSYLACLILKQKGYRCKNLSGGYTTYLSVRESLS